SEKRGIEFAGHREPHGSKGAAAFGSCGGMPSGTFEAHINTKARKLATRLSLRCSTWFFHKRRSYFTISREACGLWTHDRPNRAVFACGLRRQWLCLRRAERLTMPRGEVAEWLNAPHSKCGMGASPSGVRIPPSPPLRVAGNQVVSCDFLEMAGGSILPGIRCSVSTVHGSRAHLHSSLG